MFSKKKKWRKMGFYGTTEAHERETLERESVKESTQTILISFSAGERNIIFPLRFCRIVKSISHLRLSIFKIRISLLHQVLCFRSA